MEKAREDGAESKGVSAVDKLRCAEEYKAAGCDMFQKKEFKKALTRFSKVRVRKKRLSSTFMTDSTRSAPSPGNLTVRPRPTQDQDPRLRCAAVPALPKN